jgi:hypothetical protein
MRQVLQYVAWTIGLGLNLMVISALLRGSYRHYRLVFAYLVALLLSTVIEIAAGTAPHSVSREVRDTYYWVDEVILQVLVFCVVIAFIDEAAKRARQSLVKRSWLIIGAGVILITSFLAHRGLRVNLRMTLVSRDLNICAVILDLILWSLLVTSRRPDHRLLLLSGGLGIQLTGAIIGQSLRQLSRSAVLPGVLLEVSTGFLGLYIWWRAFRPTNPSEPSKAGPPTR